MNNPPTAEEQDEYRRKCREFGFKVGDKVLVRRKVSSYSNGWNGDWHVEMDAMVGKECKIVDIGSSTGSPKLSGERGNFFFPYHSLMLDELEQPFSGPPPMTDQFIPPPSE